MPQTQNSLRAIVDLEDRLAALTLVDASVDTADDTPSVDFVQSHLSSPDVGVRYHAIEAAGRRAISDALPAILQCLLNDAENIDVRIAATKACGRLSASASSAVSSEDHLLNAMVQLSTHANARARKAAVKACGVMFEIRKRGRGSAGRGKKAARKKKSEKVSDCEGGAAKAVVGRLLDDDADVRMAAVNALVKLGRKTKEVAIKQVTKLVITNPAEGATVKALISLDAQDVLEELADHPSQPVWQAACRALQDSDTFEQDDADNESNYSTYDHRILEAKKRLRPRATAWSNGGLRIEKKSALRQAMDASDVRDKLERIDYAKISSEDWDALGLGRKPQVIKGVTSTEHWAAREWTEDLLRSKWGQAKFRVGSDEEDRDVRLTLDDFLRYNNSNQDGNPMYLFEHVGEGPLEGILDEYSIPKYFEQARDLLSIFTPEERPPFRWMLYGGHRSGSAIHKDPLCTSAWNTSLFGRKRWMLFPPHARKVHLMPASEEALWPARIAGPSSWFEHMLSRVRSPEWRGPAPIEILQEAGETVYVPAGWWHIVLNLDRVCAVTQNVGALHDYKDIERIMKRKRPDIYEEWIYRVRQKWPELIDKLHSSSRLV